MRIEKLNKEVHRVKFAELGILHFFEHENRLFLKIKDCDSHFNVIDMEAHIFGTFYDFTSIVPVEVEKVTYRIK